MAIICLKSNFLTIFNIISGHDHIITEKKARLPRDTSLHWPVMYNFKCSLNKVNAQPKILTLAR